MPAAVAVPLITTAIGSGVSIYQQKKQNDAAKAAANATGARPNPTAGGGSSTYIPGGSSNSYSSGSHSESSGGTVIDPEVRNAAFGANSRFLENGGLSQQDLAAMRSRALSPVRAAYSDATREINRTSALQGGYSPNRVAALSRMARERGQGVADAATNAEAGIVGLRQQGQLAGLQGMNSMYANMPTFNQSVSDSWGSGGGSSNEGYDPAALASANKGPGFLDYLRGAGEAVLPSVLSAFGNRGPQTTGGYTTPSGPITTGLPGGLPGTPINPPYMPGTGSINLPPPVQGLPNGLPGTPVGGY